MPVVKLNRAIKYRAYPTEGQAVLLAKTFYYLIYPFRTLTQLKNCLSEDRQQLFLFYLNAFHPTALVVGFPG